jgi:hypothetical protein
MLISQAHDYAGPDVEALAGSEISLAFTNRLILKDAAQSLGLRLFSAIRAMSDCFIYQM